MPATESRERVIDLEEGTGDLDAAQLMQLTEEIHLGTMAAVNRMPVIPVPMVAEFKPWVPALKKDSWIFLCKEQVMAQVTVPWQVIAATGVTGYILFRPTERHITRWVVDQYGRGEDSKPLILPVMTYGELTMNAEEVTRRLVKDATS